MWTVIARTIHRIILQLGHTLTHYLRYRFVSLEKIKNVILKNEFTANFKANLYMIDNLKITFSI